MTDDLELRKRIAAEAQVESATAASPAVRAFQFFLVPLFIVGACVLVYVLISWLTLNPRSAKEWLQDIRGGGENTRHHAALQLVQVLRRQEKPDATITPDLMDLYSRAGPQEHELRRFMATCMGFVRDERACDLLLEAVRSDRNMETRAACLDALGTIKDPGTIPALMKLLDDEDGVIRKYAAFNLAAVAGEAGDRGVIEPLRRKLNDPRADVGWNAAFGLAYFLSDGSGTDTLKRMLDRKYLAEHIRGDDPDEERLAARAMFLACNAAARLKDASFLPLLRGLIDPGRERDADVRFMANKAIRAIEPK